MAWRLSTCACEFNLIHAWYVVIHIIKHFLYIQHASCLQAYITKMYKNCGAPQVLLLLPSTIPTYLCFCFQEFHQYSLRESEYLIAAQKSEIKLLREKLKRTNRTLADCTLCSRDFLDCINVRTERKYKVGKLYCLVYLCQNEVGKAWHFALGLG